MAARKDNFLSRLLHRRVLRHWAVAQTQVAGLGPAALRRLRGQARALRRELDQTIQLTELRLSETVSGVALPRSPLGTDWVWRPDLWAKPMRPTGHVGVQNHTEISPGASVFHDCPASSVSLRQTPDMRPGDLASYGLQLEVLHFGGTFLSLAIDLPDDAARGLRLRHVVRLALTAEAERGGGITARLNVAHGPNTEQLTQRLAGGVDAVEFDLAYSKLNEARVERAWLDLIFDDPAMNRIVLRDLVLSRRPRADV